MTTADAATASRAVERPTEAPFLSRVRLRAQRRARWLQACWNTDGNDSRFAITKNEVARILADPAEVSERERALYQVDETSRVLSRLIEQADQQAASHPYWNAVRKLFYLADAEADLLALAVCVAVDPPFGRVCAYLQDDATATQATPLLAAALFQWPAGTDIPASSALAKWRLARPSEIAAVTNAPNGPWKADPQVVQWLFGRHAVKIADVDVNWIRRTDVARLECLYPEPLQAMKDFLAVIKKHGRRPIEFELIAPAGSGKRTLAAQFCSGLKRDLLVIDCDVLFPADLSRTQVADRVFEALRTARLEQAVICWNNADTLLAASREIIAGLAELSIFASEAPVSRLPGLSVVRQTYELPSLESTQRLRLWQQFTQIDMPSPVLEWSLRPAEIRAAAQVGCAGADAVLAECRRMLQHDGELTSTLKCPYTWDDLVLSPLVRKQLEELSAQARLRNDVLETWGFDRLCPMGRGISALFAGPSGTGKTMAAQVLARELGRELCRVDLAEVMNKYIGETEKRLKRVFDTCERSAVVLFFDEADALFGQRSQVKDAHDRYANIQIDYLLQRMEQFDGIAILATNRKNDVDTAFLRRLRFIVDFYPPGPQERIELWRKALAEQSPSGEDLLGDIDWDWLAETLSITGADIKAAALAAAFLARAEDSKIGMNHLLHATRREMAKQNASWRTGDWNKKK